MKFQTALLMCAALALAGILFSGLWRLQANTTLTTPNSDGPANQGRPKDPLDLTAKVGPLSQAAIAAEDLETATFGTGCFWCTEAIFEQLNGVETVISGYSGGHTENPTYDDISTGTSGHAEVVQIKFDPHTISFQTLLRAFWMAHDPTTLNRQGDDEGPQYRSVIFYHSEEQEKLAERAKEKLTESNAFGKPIVTEITPFGRFFKAENQHQDFFATHGHVPYCQFSVKPKLEKFKKAFSEMQKHDTKH